MTRYNVYLNNRCIDTVSYNSGIDINEVKTSLIEHDGYSSDIVVTPEFITRSMYMDDSTNLHTIYYNQFATPALQNRLRKHPVYEQCRVCADKHYNGIHPMRFWDNLGLYVTRNQAIIDAKEGLSTSTQVCTVTACIRYMIANE